MLPADYHFHDHFSPDSSADFVDYLEMAKKRGISELCLTNHAEFDPYCDHQWTIDLEENYEEFQYWQGREKSLSLRFGYELGIPDNAEDIADAFRRIPELPYDYVLASVHNYQGKSVFSSEWYEGRSYPEAVEAYLAVILDRLKAIGSDAFDAVGHIDCSCKAFPGSTGSEDLRVRYAYFADTFDSFARYLIENGKTMEINTSAWKHLGSLEPHGLDYLRRFRELGAEFLAFGSDAHRADFLGYRFDEAAELAKAAGFRYYASYRGRKPEPKKL